MSTSSRMLAAIMFADIVGYSALMQRDEHAAAKMRAKHRHVFNSLHDKNNGKIIQYYGDGALSIFKSAVEAVTCAVAIQQKLRSGDIVVPLRIGVHVGDIVLSDAEVYGDGVNIAARIEGIAESGSVLISSRLNDDLVNHPAFVTQSLGFFDFKNIEKRMEVFALVDDELIIPKKQQQNRSDRFRDKSIAVLPFVNMSPGKDDEYICDGITEETIIALSKIEGLRVTSRTSSFYFKGQQLPITQIGAELNVSTILEGSLRIIGSKMRLRVQLIDVSQDTLFFTETFERSIENIFAVQDELSLLIADRLREEMGHLEFTDQLVDDPEVSIELYKDYLKARYHVLKMNKTHLEIGISIFNKIIDRDPTFLKAYLGMHLAYSLLGTLGQMPAEEAFAIGSPYLEKAIELDDENPECQIQLAYIAFLQKWDIASAFQHLNNARKIRPTTDFYQTMASITSAQKNIVGALNYADEALKMDPLSNINYHLKGFIYYVDEQYKEAQVWFQKSMAMDDDFMASKLYYGQSLLLSGQVKAGQIFFEQFEEDENDLTKIGGLTLAHILSGNLKKAKAGISRIKKAMNTALAQHAMLFLPPIYTHMKDEEEAMNVIENIVLLKMPMAVYLFSEPLLKPLHSNSRFQELRLKVLGEPTVTPLPPVKIKMSLFKQNELLTYRQTLKKLMETEKPFLQPDLTLRRLAEYINLSTNRMSQLLNEGFGKSFSEYVNAYRLDCFKLKARDSSNQHLTILAIAYDCGFNSKTVFNTYFKKKMGVTPSAWVKDNS